MINLKNSLILMSLIVIGGCAPEYEVYPSTQTLPLDEQIGSDEYELRIQKETDALYNKTTKDMTTPHLDSSPVGEAQADLDDTKSELEYEQRMQDIEDEY